MAQSHPNPNVDGVAYIDDFEGSRDSYSLGIFRELWTLSSRPAGLDTASHRAQLIWYNPYDQVATNSIWNRELKPGESGTHTLWVRFEPGKLDRRAGEYTANISYDSTRAWNGLMRYMPAGSANQDAAQLLELRIQGEKGIIHFEMGVISEDVNGNDSLDTEEVLVVFTTTFWMKGKMSGWMVKRTVMSRDMTLSQIPTPTATIGTTTVRAQDVTGAALMIMKPLMAPKVTPRTPTDGENRTRKIFIETTFPIRLTTIFPSNST